MPLCSSNFKSFRNKISRIFDLRNFYVKCAKLGKAFGGLIWVGIYVVITKEALMQPASKSEAAMQIMPTLLVNPLRQTLLATLVFYGYDFRSRCSFQFFSVSFRSIPPCSRWIWPDLRQQTRSRERWWQLQQQRQQQLPSTNSWMTPTLLLSDITRKEIGHS